MGCTQSKNVLDTPVSMHTTSSDAAYAHETSLLDATKQVRRSFNSSRLQSRHRDVFSIFGERGMALDTHDHETSSPVFGAHLLSSPFSASGSVFSTATTASDTERTMVFQNDATDRSIPALGVTYGAYSDKGMRKQNEDRHTCTSDVIANDTYGYFGVYDGHGGAKVAEYLENNLHTAVFDALRNSSSSGTHGSISMEKAITEAFATTDDVIFKNQIESGATALALVVRGRDAVVACVGDSQAVLSANGKARTLSVIHSPDSEKEKERITKAHGVVVKGRIFGLLGVSRAFGDNDFKTSKGDYKHKFDGDLVTAVPHVHALSVAPDDEFVVLGCDGLFDVMDAQQVVDFVRAKLALHGHVQHACEELVSYAISIGSTDNVTATIVCFNQTVVEEQEQEDDDDEHDDHKRATDHV